jgi:predicted MFS family arabinose efflux permease
MGYLELLRTQRGFLRLWLGQLVSECGDWLQIIALLALFPTRGPSVKLIAGLLVVRMLPGIVWAPLAGVVADRFPRGRVMVVTDLVRAAVVLSYLFIRGPEDVVWIYVLMFAQESLTCFFEPARVAAIPQVVERRGLLAANSLAGATWSAMLAIGAALGGTIAHYVGAQTAFIANAVTFLVSAVLIGGIHIPRPGPAGADSRGAPDALGSSRRDSAGMGAVKEGILFLRGHRAQAVVATVKGLWGMSGGIVFLFSIYAGEIFTDPGENPAGATGLLYAGRGVGAFCGPLIAKRLMGESVKRLRSAIQIAFPLAACAIVAFSYAPNAVVGALLLVLVHAGGSIVWVSSTQLLQLTVPNHFLGRVASVELAGLMLTVSISTGITGMALSRGFTSLRGATFAMAAAAAVATIVWLLSVTRFGQRLDEAAAMHDSPDSRRHLDAPV